LVASEKSVFTNVEELIKFDIYFRIGYELTLGNNLIKCSYIKE